MDYEYDGGFVGRREERKNLKKRLLDKRIHPVITVSGAGGVGKTALAHYVCEEILANNPEAFDGLVWISAKKDKLTVTGIEEIEPQAQSFEQVLDAILETFGFTEYVASSVDQKKQLIQDVIIEDFDAGLLLVIDNLETILHDTTLIEYIKDIPLPHKVLITSRRGLGEAERRIPIEQMSSSDAVELFRIIAREKSVKDLATMPTDAIKPYVKRMSGYPLVIKWVVGQAAVNKDIERLVQSINSTDSDISKFCFEFIFDTLLSENSKLILQVLATSDQELTQPILMHVGNLSTQEFEDVMFELELESLITPNQEIDETSERIVTRYGILPLTRAYILSREGSQREIKAKLQSVQNLAEEARRAKRQYELSLEYLGAENDGELIASKHVQAAFLRNQAGDYLGAMDALQRAIEIAPNFAAIYRSWAVIESSNKNYDQAVNHFEKAVSLNPNDPTTWFHWGTLEKNQSNYDSARRYLNRALTLVSNKIPVLINLGNVEKQDSNFSEAIEFFEEAIRLTLEDSTAITDKNVIVAHTSMADTFCRWAEVYERDKQLDTAIEKASSAYNSMEQVAKLGSNDAKTRETQMRCRLILGRLFNRKSEIAKAKTYYQEITDMEMSPRIWSWEQRRLVTQACYALVPILLDEDNVEEAKRLYEHGLSCMIPHDYFKDRYLKLSAILGDEKRYEGKFVRVLADRNFGFITCEELGPIDVFAHRQDVVDDIGDDFSALRNVWVSFSVESVEKGLAAKAIRIMTLAGDQEKIK